MGKDKSGQRTKGNLKPSSSGRSAEILGGVSGFVGFSGLSDLGYVPAALQGGVDDDSQISGEFRVTLRKMSKKDATTKIKALQEFETLCASEDIESIKTALPYWPRLYCKLSLDCERRVREAAHSAHSSLVAQIGKQLAPYLRSVMPCWLLSMVDPHAPAAIAATKSFQAAFSEDKRPGVMVFCAKEIVEFIADNLFIQSPQTLSDPKITSTEDQESKYIRVLFCSLKGLCLFLDTTSKLNDKKAEIVAKIKPIIQEEKYWKLEKHESSLVRSSWYDTIKAFFEFDVNMLQDDVAQLTKAVFSSLDCSDSFVLPHIWIAFLHLCVGLPKCWEQYGNSKSVFNRIYSVLRDGGRGSAEEICPQLLPILSIIPYKAMENPIEFYKEFFRSISISLRKERILANRREATAIIIALIECLRYMSKQHGDNEELWNILIQYQIVELLVGSFMEYPQLSEMNLYHEIGKLLHYWTNLQNKEKKSKHSGKLQLFWQLFLPRCNEWISEGSDDLLIKLKQFLKIIKDPYSAQARRSRGVRFEDESEISLLQDGELAGTQNTSTLYPETLAQYVAPLIQNCFDTYSKTSNEKVFNLFASLLYSYSSDKAYQKLIKNQVGEPSLAKKLFLEESVLPLLEDKKVSLATTVDIFLHVYQHLEADSQKYFLLNLKPTVKIGGLKFLVKKMTERYELDPVAALWLKSPQLGCRLVKCIQQLIAITLAEGSLEVSTIREEYEHLVELMKFVFSNGNKQCTVFSLEYIDQLLKSLTVALKQLETEQKPVTDRKKTEVLVLIIDFLTDHINSFVCWRTDGLGDILKALYQRIYNPVYSQLSIMTQVQQCVLKGLERNIEHLLHYSTDSLLTDRDSLLLYILEESKCLILSPDSSFSIIVKSTEFLETVLLLFFNALPQTEDCSIILDHSMIQASLDRLMPSVLEWNELEEELCPLYTSPAILSGSFICREFPLPVRTHHPRILDHRYTRVCLFAAKLLLRLCTSVSSVNLEKGESTDAAEEHLSLGQFTQLAVVILHGACYSSALLQMKLSLNDNRVSEDVKMGTEHLSEAVQSLLSLINEGNQKHILKLIRDRCSYGNTMWCVTFIHVLSNWIRVPFNASKLIEEMDKDLLGYTETKQILLPYVPKNYIVSILSEEKNKLSNLFDDPFTALPSLCLITSSLELLSATTAYSSELNEDDSQVIKDTIHLCFSVLVKWRDAASNIFLFASDLHGVPWEDVSLMVSIIRLLSVIVKGHSLHLLHSQWDVTLCALSAWTQSLLEAPKNQASDSTIIAMFSSACSECAAVISELIAKLRKDPTLRSEYPPTLVEEWDEFFSPSIFQAIILNFIHCNSVYQRNRSVILYSICQSMAVSISTAEGPSLKDISLPPLFNVADAEAQSGLPENIQSFLNHFASALLSFHPPCQCAAYNALDCFLPTLMASWEENQANIDDQDDLPQKPLPRALINVIQEAELVVGATLQDKELGCCCEVVPFTDTHTYTAGYLLAWLLTLTSVTHAATQNHQLYSSYIRESGLLFTLLDNLFKLMPLEPYVDKNQVTKSSATMFNSTLTVSPCGVVSSETISWLACQVYIRCLMQLPAAVRNWFTNLDRGNQQIVDKYTATHASPILIANEINAINDSTVKFDNMMIKCRPGAREIVATYTIDEASMELVLRMAPNHPLSTISLEDHKRVGVSITQWRNWLFGLSTMLSHRNTPLLNSLEFWKKNVDQKFEGIEECFICYYVLHGTNHQIPKLLCRTCKKKFHSACLYKWFSTSNNSTCPICRSLF